MVDDYDRQVRRLKDEALRFCWYMRGGLTYDEAMCLDQNEREIINAIVKQNMEVTQKSGMPFF